MQQPAPQDSDNVEEVQSLKAGDSHQWYSVNLSLEWTPAVVQLKITQDALVQLYNQYLESWSDKQFKKK